MEQFNHRSRRTWKQCAWIVGLWIASLHVLLAGADNLALLAGTLRTFQKAACEGDVLSLRCPVGTSVSIQLAQYGKASPDIALCPSVTASSHNTQAGNDTCLLTSSMQYNLLQAVVDACQKKRFCKISTQTLKFEGDACPSHTKFVEVAYKCRPSEFRSKVICQNEEITLKCKKNARVAIYSANFGRTKYDSLQCPQPAGVEEETCQASYATESVMQVCHGKRRCSLAASPSTFGNPCNPQSKLYLRAVYTCVSRKILKDQYQGSLEEDESEIYEDEESSFENDDLPPGPSDSWNPSASPFPAGAPSSPNDDSVTRMGYKTSATKNAEVKKDKEYLYGAPSSNNKAGILGASSHPTRSVVTSAVDRDMQGDISGDLTRQDEDHHPLASPTSTSSVLEQQANATHATGFITEWMTAFSFIKNNQEKFILYLTLSIAAGILVFLSLLIGRLWYQRRKARQEAKLHVGDPLPAFADDVSDVDTDIDLTMVPPLTDVTTSLETVRYTTRNGTIRRQDSDTNPRSLNRSSNNHYYYG